MVQYLKADDQTMSDLAILAKPGKPSVYDVYNRTVTQGGAARLEALFRHPLSDETAINAASQVFRFFSERSYAFPVDSATVGQLAYYMENDDVRSRLHTGDLSLGQRVRDMVAADATHVFVHDGVQAALRLFHQVNTFLQAIGGDVQGSAYEPAFRRLADAIDAPAFSGIKQHATGKFEVRLNNQLLAALDKQVRFEHRETVLDFLDRLYELDVLMAIGRVARERGFSFARALPKESGILSYRNVYHPHVEGAIANDLVLEQGSNVLFLTGANMAGKSTLMKSVGVALYLAHMGLPIAAESLEFAVRDGIYTSINLADNLNAGASHYYAEVLRVKDVATALSRGDRLLVIFDELFRGTNVKDAYDATIAITSAFCNKADSQFIISTHIMEAGEVLQQQSLPITYQFLPTEMQGNTPVYTRKLRTGVTADRQGMIIIQNEGILDMLDAGIKRTGREHVVYH